MRHTNLGDKKLVNQQINNLQDYQNKQQSAITANYMMEDPSIYAYDDYLDTKQSEQKIQAIQQKEERKLPKQSQFIGTILQASQKRRDEQLLIKSRMNARESVKFGSNEVYVSESFKKQYTEAKKFEEIDEIQEKVNEIRKEQNKAGILQSLYNNNQFQGGNRGIETEIKDQYQEIKSIVDGKAEKSRKRSRSRSIEKEAVIEKSDIRQTEGQVETTPDVRGTGEDKSERLRKYKERYLDRKQMGQ